MAPLMCASVTDLYGETFGMTPEQMVKRTLKQNEVCSDKNVKYQAELKENEIAGTANFKEKKPDTDHKLPGPPPPVINESHDTRHVGWSDINNKWPTNQNFSMYNRFQNPSFGGSFRELFGNNGNIEYLNNEDCLHHLVKLVKELLLMIKIIMFVLILLFLIKILDKKT